MEPIGWGIIVWVMVGVSTFVGGCLGFALGRASMQPPELGPDDLAYRMAAERGEWLCDIERARAKRLARERVS